MIEQNALINFLISMAKNTGLTEKDALLAVTTLSFDIAGLELYMPLIAGARVVIAGRDEVTDGKRLIDMLKEYGITIMQATPATWRLLMESGWTGKEDLRVLCGGEALPRDLANQLLDRCSVLLNVYGPTETTIWSTCAKVESYEGPIPIGKPIANTQVYVLDKLMNPVPVGIPGELLIGGDGLARGYLHLPELTMEKFVKDLFSKKENARLYKTGDLVKFAADGSLEFVGRTDHQVKIRGFRIELGEIETLLNRNPGIKESVVIAKEISLDEKSLVAYVIPASSKKLETLNTENLRKYLKETLPDYMVPAAFMIMEVFPMTPNGKIDRKALPMPENLRPQLQIDYVAPGNEVEKVITAIWQEVLKLERIGMNDNFFDLGGHSLLLAKVRNKIAQLLNKDISMMDLFKYPTISTLSKYLEGRCDSQPEAAYGKHKEEKGKRGTDIAVIGLSGRFPGARNIEEFWRNLCDGVESISRFTDEQILEEGIDPEVLKKPGYVKAWGALDDIDKFDAAFFGYNPREAEILDPQQRIFLEESWKALENSGYDSEKYNGLIGVFASVGMNTYAQNLKEIYGSKGLASDYQIMTSNDKDFLATRVAYKMNLEGPGITVQTACSSSLVAVHLACQSLINGECDMALAGGVSIRMPQKSGYLYQDGMILSPDGHCRAFDDQAKGTVGGNGAGVVVLKRLEDAIADGDEISAVVKGSAINNDGALKIGYTAPRIDGQAKAVAEAQNRAGIEPETITYIEAHGTGTLMGDPIEVEALTQVFNKKTDKKGFCAVGSVKTNIGHLDAASGITGFIKTVLSLRNKVIPPSLNFSSPNPKINFKESPFFVNMFLTEWKNSSSPLRAGVSSFGIGGTNAHVVLEEAPVLANSEIDNMPLLLVFSAKSHKALDKMTSEFALFLKNNRDINLADAAYTLQLGRREFECRRFLVCTSVETAIMSLDNVNGEAGKVYSSIEGQTLSSSRSKIDNPEDYSLEQIGTMWLEGTKIDWNRLYKGQKRKRIALPVYPFDGQTYWVKKSNQAEAVKPVLKTQKRADISEWFYTPIWKQSVEDISNDNVENAKNKEIILVLTDGKGFAGKLAKRLREKNADAVVAFSGNEYKKIDSNNFIIDCDANSHYESLLKDISGMGRMPGRIINLLGITSNNSASIAGESLIYGERLFYSLFYTAQALGRLSLASPIQLKVITNNSQKIFSEQDICYEKALHLGAIRVIPREYPNIKCSSIDVVLPEPGGMKEQDMIDQMLAEIYAQCDESIIAYRGLQRWKQEFESIKLDSKKNSAVKLKNNGVYLITGGLGGIAFAMADYLAREVKAKLVLVGRSEFPSIERWDEWLASHNKKDSTSRKILKLRQYQAQGSEVLICQADVTDMNQMNRVRKEVLERFGAVDGIIHAAGIPGGGMIQLKKRENAKQVLAPKVQGTMVLYEVFKDSGLDFMIFCSSLNAITGGFGQIDYSAANAFLDAFAQAHDDRKCTRIISIDWDRWPGVGMATGMGVQEEEPEEDLHPLLGKSMNVGSEKIIYGEELSPEKDWVLSEHLVMGVPTIAGTTYLEMARAAYEDITSNNNAQIREVVFMNPLSVKSGDKRNVYTIMNKNGNIFDFRIISKRSSEDNESANWLEHVRGKIAPSNENTGKGFNISELKEKCSTRAVFSSDSGQKLSEEFISFGSRWRSLKKFSLGDKEGLVEVELAKAHISDFEHYKVHPALLDVATGAVRLAAGGNYLPFSYEKLEIKGRLPERIYGYIRFKNEYGSDEEVITCDIDIIGEDGTHLIEIVNFSMKLVGESAAANFKSKPSAGMQQTEYASLAKAFEETVKNKSGLLGEGITSAEGQEALGLIVKGCSRSQVIVSTKDIHSAIEQANYINQQGIKDGLDEAAATRERYPRPELENEYVQPKNETEKKLAELWQGTLGIDKVGIHDEFFALGGDSLLLIQLHSKLKEMFETDIAVVDLYKYNTVALLSKYLSSDNAEEEQPAFEEVNSRVNKQLELMKQRRQQIQRRKGVVTGE